MRIVSLISRFEVRNPSREPASVWINDDIRPLPPARRLWTKRTYISWWTVWQFGLANWQLGSSLVAIGLSVWQAMLAVILGRCLTATVAILIGYAGAEWHIGYPVFSRAIWGVYGSYLPIFQRVLLSVLGFAFQSFVGGLCITAILSAIFPSFHRLPNTLPASSHVTTSSLIGWFVFNAVSIPLLYVRPEKSERTIHIMNAMSFTALLGILIWSLATAHGAGPLLSTSGILSSSDELGWGITQAITAVIGSLAIALTSQPDFSRFAKHPKDQIFGQWFALIIVGSIMPLFGCLSSSATMAIYGEAIWNPPVILLTWLGQDYNAKSRAGAFFAGVGLASCQIAVNIVDNGYGIGMDMSGLFPKYINIRRGAYIGLALSMALCPWELIASASVFVSVISSFAVFMGPICGLQVCDYWLIRQRKIKLSDLYHPSPSGIYFFSGGVNWRSFISWLVGWAPLLPGFIHAIRPSIHVPIGASRVYALGFPFGFVTAFIVHLILNKTWPPRGLGEIDTFDVYGTFTAAEAEKFGILCSTDSTSSDVEHVHGSQGESKMSTVDAVV